MFLDPHRAYQFMVQVYLKKKMKGVVMAAGEDLESDGLAGRHAILERKGIVPMVPYLKGYLRR